jgi:hypothetical protein
MHWNQYASPRQQREWSRIQAELNAMHVRDLSASRSVKLTHLDSGVRGINQRATSFRFRFNFRPSTGDSGEDKR